MESKVFAMDEKMYRLDVLQTDQEAFFLCLALGTLEAMRGGNWPLEAGIWTFRRPNFWEELAEVDEKVIKALDAADELDALAGVAGYAKAEASLDRMIAVVRARLAALPEKSWYAHWSSETGG